MYLSSPSSLQSSTLSTQCIIGRLRQCNDDEDCVELPSPQKPQVNVIISSQNGSTLENVIHSATFVSVIKQQRDLDTNTNNSSSSFSSNDYERLGTCTCRNSHNCKRTQLQQRQQKQQSHKIVLIGKIDENKLDNQSNLGLC